MFVKMIGGGASIVAALAISSTAGAARDRGQLLIQTIPWSKVFIDGKLTGTTPLRIKLAPRVYTIRLVKPGYRETVRRVTIRPRHTIRLAVKLSRDPERRGAAKKKRGRLKIATSPWARVYIDGKLAGNTPLTVDLKPERHRLRLVNDGTKPVERTVTIEAGKTTRLVLRLPAR